MIENVNVVIFYFLVLRVEIMRISPKCLSNLSLSVFIFYFIAAKINDFSLIKQDAEFLRNTLVKIQDPITH